MAIDPPNYSPFASITTLTCCSRPTEWFQCLSETDNIADAMKSFGTVDGKYYSLWMSRSVGQTQRPRTSSSVNFGTVAGQVWCFSIGKLNEMPLITAVGVIFIIDSKLWWGFGPLRSKMINELPWTASGCI